MNCGPLASKRMSKRERVRELADKGPKPVKKTFAVGERVIFFDEVCKHWKNFGHVTDVRTQGASRVQSYYIKTE